MVGAGPACGYEFIPDRLGEWNVYQVVGMHVADLVSPEAILRASKAMWLGCDPRPTLQSGIYSFFGP
jgi:hypothetical protein